MRTTRVSFLKALTWIILISVFVVLEGCGGSSSDQSSGSGDPSSPTTASASSNYAVDVNVTGLSGSVILENGHDSLTATKDGSYTISKNVPSGTAYSVRIASQPSNETCGVTNASGAVSSSDVANIFVNCSQLTNNAKILSSDEVTNAVSSVAPNSLTFTQLPSDLQSLAAGDVIFSGTNTKTPDGLLRKVVSVTNNSGQTIVTTAPAQLTDLVKNGGFDNSVDLSAALTAAAHSNDVRISPYAKLMSVTSAVDYCANKKSDFVLNFDNQPISPNISVSGCAGLSLTLETSGTISDSQLKSFQIIATGTVSQALNVTTTASQGDQFNYTWDLTENFDGGQGIPVSIPIGPFDIPAHLKIGIVLSGDDTESAPVTVGVASLTSVKVGATIADGQVTTIHDFSPSTDLIGPNVSAGSSVDFALGPQVSYEILGMAGPELTLAIPYFKFKSDVNANPWWEADSGVGAQLDLAPDTSNIFAIDAGSTTNLGTIFNQQNVLKKASGAYDGTFSPPTANFSFTPQEPVQNQQIAFTDLSTDSDGHSLSWSWDFGDNSTSTEQNPTHTFQNAGTYDVTLTTTDSVGLSNTKTQTISVAATPVNHPPVANAGADQTVAKGNTVMLDGSASSDPDNDNLTYSWTIVSKPVGSSATLDDPAAAQPTFVADVIGDYEIQLVVNDGKTSSLPDTVTVSSGLTLSQLGFTFSTLDDFNAGSIDTSLWYVDGANPPSSVSVSNGTLIAHAENDSGTRVNTGLSLRQPESMSLTQKQAFEADFKFTGSTVTGAETNEGQLLLGFPYETNPDGEILSVDTGIDIYPDGTLSYFVEIFSNQRGTIREVSYGDLGQVPTGSTATLAIALDGNNILFSYNNKPPLSITIDDSYSIDTSSPWSWGIVRAVSLNDGTAGSTGSATVSIDNVKVGSNN